MTSCSPQSKTQRVSGFTLIELLVVISLIIILVGLVIATQTENRGPVNATKNTMQALQNIATEYEVLTGRTIGHLQADPKPVNWATQSCRKNVENTSGSAVMMTIVPPDGSNTAEDVARKTIERFVWATYSNSDMRKMYDALGPETVRDTDGNGFLEVLDGWEGPIFYGAYVDHNAAGAEATVDNFLPEFGSQTKKRPFFASSGRDGKFGDIAIADTTDDEYKRRKDNLFSYNLD